MKVYIVRPFENNTIGTETLPFLTVDALLAWYSHDDEYSVTERGNPDTKTLKERISNNTVIAVQRKAKTAQDVIDITVEGTIKLYHVTVTDLHE